MPVDGAAVRLSYEGFSAEVRCADRSHLDWLEEFVSPHFETDDGGASHRLVSLIFDEDRFDEIARRGPSGAHASAFVLDDAVVVLPVWKAEGSERVLFDEKYRVFYLVDGERVTLLARKNRLNVRTPLMRVVREFAMNHAQRAGSFFLHASSFAVGERAVVIAGPKNAGKTTLLMYALQDPATRYLTNDRLLVSFDEAGFRLRGMPTILAVREGTFELFPELRSDVFGRGFHFRSTLKEAEHGKSPSPRPWEDGRLGLTPAQTCALLDRRPVAEARPGALLFPRITHREGSIELREIRGASAADRLLDSLFGAKHLGAVSEVFDLPGGSPERERSELRRLCLELTVAVDCFDCALGRGAYSGSHSAREFVGRAANAWTANRKGGSHAAR
jgi:hypothetical protein